MGSHHGGFLSKKREKERPGAFFFLNKSRRPGAFPPFFREFFRFLASRGVYSVLYGNISLSAFAPENLVSRDGSDSPVPRQPAHLHTYSAAESGKIKLNTQGAYNEEQKEQIARRVSREASKCRRRYSGLGSPRARTGFLRLVN